MAFGWGGVDPGCGCGFNYLPMLIIFLIFIMLVFGMCSWWGFGGIYED